MATILIVDDSLDDRTLLARLLQKHGFSVLEAGNSGDGLRLTRSEHPAFVVADVVLPEADGYEFVRQLRGDPAIARTPVAFWTGVYHEPQDALELATVCGVVRVIPKSADPQEVLEAINAALGAPPSLWPALPETFDSEHMRVMTEKLREKVLELQVVKRKLRQFEIHYPEKRARPILLVEDNPMDVDLTLQAFGEHALANPIAICRDGEEALQFIEAHATPGDPHLPLLVLLDLRLLKVDGLEVLRQARQHPVWKQIPIVVITTSRENVDISRAYELGANSFIVKPMDFASFAEVVKHIKVYWLLDNRPPF